MTIDVIAKSTETGAETKAATVETMAEAWGVYETLSHNHTVRFEPAVTRFYLTPMDAMDNAAREAVCRYARSATELTAEARTLLCNLGNDVKSIAIRAARSDVSIRVEL